jgi:hypothetical protein
MRARSLAVVLAIVGSLAACSSSGGKSSTSPSTASSGSGAGPSSGGAATSAFCTNLAKVPAQVNALTADATNLPALKQALQAEGPFLQGLKASAPAELDAPIDDLITQLGQAEQALTNLQSPDLTKLAGIVTQAPLDVAKLTAYAKANCPAT